MPAITPARELRAQGLQGKAVDQEMEKEIKAGSIRLPDHATAGYRMLGPIGAYDAGTNTATSEIQKWQSVHLPFQNRGGLGASDRIEARHAVCDGVGHLVGARDDRALS